MVVMVLPEATADVANSVTELPDTVPVKPLQVPVTVPLEVQLPPTSEYLMIPAASSATYTTSTPGTATLRSAKKKE